MAEGDTAAGAVKFKKLGLKRLPRRDRLLAFLIRLKRLQWACYGQNKRRQRHFRLHAPIAGQ